MHGLFHSEYIAPTFTWASICCEVFMNDIASKPPFFEKCQVITAETSMFDTDPFGRVKGGSIQLHGSLIATRLISGTMATSWRHGSGYEHDVLLGGKQYPINPDINIGTFTFLNERGETETSICRSRNRETVCEEVDGAPAHLFLLGLNVPHRYHVQWLVLGRSSRDPKSYERVAFLEFWLEEVDWLKLEDMIKDTPTEAITIV